MEVANNVLNENAGAEVARPPIIPPQAQQQQPQQQSKAFICAQKLRELGGPLTRDDFDGGPISLDEIEPGLYLGNLSAATHMETLKLFRIAYVLTLDSVPLPKHITEASFLTTKYVQIADMPKEDILQHLDGCLEFIKTGLNSKAGNVLVHCYFGVSRSSTVVIAYIMQRRNYDYQQAFEFVKSKRRFVHPNAGFIAQLKLYKRMGCKINPQYQKYKTYRLRLAGDQMRKVKILPQNFHNLIKTDPGVTQENPEPIVYRCRKCRRILANKSNVLTHQYKIAPESSNENATNENNQTKQVSSPGPATQTPKLLEQIAAQIRKVSLVATGNDRSNSNNDEFTGEGCQQIIFIEPITWMKHIMHNTQGRLNCPKCDQKLGSFSWINGCLCPCGENVTPAFYLIPSKVELSKAVQNVQTTV